MMVVVISWELENEDADPFECIMIASMADHSAN